MHDDGLFLSGDPTTAVRLMFAMTLAGMATEQGLKVIADLWRDFVPEGSTHWQEVAHRNRLTLQVLDEQGLKTDDFTPQDERSSMTSGRFHSTTKTSA